MIVYRQVDAEGVIVNRLVFDDGMVLELETETPPPQMGWRRPAPDQPFEPPPPPEEPAPEQPVVEPTGG